MDLKCPDGSSLLKNSLMCGGNCDDGFVPSTVDDTFCVIDDCQTLTEDAVDNSLCLKLESNNGITDIQGQNCEEGYVELYPGKCYILCTVDQDNVLLKEGGTHCIKTKIKRNLSASFCPAFYGYDGKNCSISYGYIFIIFLLIFVLIACVQYIIKKNKI
jgi:hypothetical protein